MSVLGSAAELNGTQTTTISLATGLFRAGETLTADSTVEDVSGIVTGQPAVYRVEGQPADRYSGVGRRVTFRAAALQLVSDLQ